MAMTGNIVKSSLRTARRSSSKLIGVGARLVVDSVSAFSVSFEAISEGFAPGISSTMEWVERVDE